MKAVVQDRYGDPAEVLKVREIDKPVARDGEVVVRVRAASVHADVWHVVMGVPYLLRLMGNGVRKPVLIAPGTDLAGHVETVGRNVSHFKAGDEVFGESVKFAWKNGGAFAEYAAVSEDLLAHKPKNVTFEQAAAVPTSGFIAVSNLGTVTPGQNVLINGAGGAVGSLAIQIAKARGARVTAVDNTEKLDMLRTLGADRVIDYTKEDFLRGGERYDFILDIASNLWFDVCEPVLTPGGTYMPIGHAHYGKATGRMGGRIVGSMPVFVGILLRTLLNPQKRKSFKMPSKQEVMALLKELLESGKLTPIIARTYPLEEICAAMQCLQEGKALGRLVITP